MSSPYSLEFPADKFVYAVGDGMRNRIIEATDTAARKGRYQVTIPCDSASDATHVLDACKLWKCPGLEEKLYPSVTHDGEWNVVFHLPVPTEAELERYRQTKHAEYLYYQEQNDAERQKYRPQAPDDGDGNGDSNGLRAPPSTQRAKEEEEEEEEEEDEEDDGKEDPEQEDPFATTQAV
jgi:hypothetical protein